MTDGLRDVSERAQRLATIAQPTRSDDTCVLNGGRRMTADDVRALVAQIEADKAGGVTERDWDEWATRLPPHSS